MHQTDSTLTPEEKAVVANDITMRLERLSRSESPDKLLTDFPKAFDTVFSDPRAFSSPPLLALSSEYFSDARRNERYKQAQQTTENRIHEAMQNPNR